jgi:hypothetical protein
MSRFLPILTLVVFLAIAPPLTTAQDAEEPPKQETYTKIFVKDDLITFEVPVVLQASSSDAFKPRKTKAGWSTVPPGTLIRPMEAFEIDASNFWAELYRFRYRTCYRIQVTVTFERNIKDIDSDPGAFKHVIEFDPTHVGPTTIIGSGPDSGLNAIDDRATGTWGWAPAHAEIGVLLGIGETTAITQEVVDTLGQIASRYVALNQCALKATQILESVSEAATAQYTSNSTLEIVATVEEDGSLLDSEATYAIEHTGLMLSDGGDCEYTSTGEGVGLVVTGNVDGNAVSLTVEGQVTLHSEYSCVPPSDTTFPLGENSGFVLIEGELVDGQFEDEQTFTDVGTTTVVTTFVEVTVEENEPVA